MPGALFEPLDLLTDGRLRSVEALCRPREGPELGDEYEGLQ